MLLSGLPVVMHSVNAFHRFDPSAEIVIAMSPAFFSLWDELCHTHRFDIKHLVAAGGNTRSGSVRNALEKIGEEGLVAIHDAVRPLVSGETIRQAFEDAALHGNAIPSLAVKDTVRILEDGISKTISREKLRIIQTPQVFKTSEIKRAYALSGPDDFTDDASVLEKTGAKIHLFEGNRENIKITFPSDLLMAESLLKTFTPGS